MFASLVIAICSVFYAQTILDDQGAWETFKVVALSTLSGLGLMGIWHLIRAPWLLERDKGKEAQRFLYGIFGVLLLAGILIGGSWGLTHLYRSDQSLRAESRRLAKENTELRNKQPEVRIVTPTPLEEPSDSLRRKTLKLVYDLNLFWSRRPQPLPKVQNPTTDEERQRNAKFDKYWQETDAAYQTAGFNERVLEIVRQYKGKGIDIGYLEEEAQQPNRQIGAVPFGGYGLGDCLRGWNDLCQLRELAYHVDAQDRPIVLTYEPSK